MRQHVVGQVSATTLDEGSGDISDHMLQKSAAANGVDETVAFAPEVGAKNGPNGGLAPDVTLVFSREGPEVVTANEARGGETHPGLIQGIRVVVDVAGIERRTDFGAIHGVAVGLGVGVEAGVEVGVNLFHVVNTDGGGEQTIDRLFEILRGDAVGEAESSYLREGVDAGVGATGTGDMNGGAFNAADDLFQHALDGGEAGLYLPAVVFRAIVRNGNADAAADKGLKSLGVGCDSFRRGFGSLFQEVRIADHMLNS